MTNYETIKHILSSTKRFLFLARKYRYLSIPLSPFAFLFYCLNLIAIKRAKRALVVNMGGIGDILMMSPMVAELSKKYQVDLIVQSPAIRSILLDQKIYSSIYVIQHYKLDRFSHPEKITRSLTCLLLFYPIEYIALSLRRYSIAINCAHFPWSNNFANVLLKALNIDKRYGFRDDTGRYLDQCVEDTLRCGPDLYLSLLSFVGITNKPSNELYYEVPELRVKRLYREVIRPRLKAGLTKIAVLHPGGKIHVNSRRWPQEYFAEVLCFLIARGYAVFISGNGSEDESVCHYLEKTVKNNVVNLCDKISFADFAALLKIADLCITNDTCTVHIANAVRCKKVISIFGPTSSKYLVGNGSRNIVIQSDLECSPCRTSVLHETVMDCHRRIELECLKSIPPLVVINEIKKIENLEGNSNENA